ncbi:uncharacterized protein Dwil_GK19153 [Drosophila willistoni]|uniref:Mpv17-like protein 2 n=1 Tax=Drosophila willistoni TaxID=7260 RepID=B4N3Z2_DROWI|nr:mpv17-like protein 2 [Drosophila willistoni]EDW79347.1 uncharacterized protein Dwil_GK19153 [Drosophila willistoni]
MWRNLALTLNRWKCYAFSSKYLIYTNLGMSVSLSMVGDAMEQSYERYTREADKWDRTRTVRMGISGFTVGFVCHFWYKYLDYVYPKRTIGVVVRKILLDQFVCSPFFLVVFFVTMGVLEKKNWAELKEEIGDKAFILYKAEWTVWPLAQLFNFFFIKPKYRVLYDNSISLGYDVYISKVKYSKVKKEAKKEDEPKIN